MRASAAGTAMRLGGFRFHNGRNTSARLRTTLQRQRHVHVSSAACIGSSSSQHSDSFAFPTAAATALGFLVSGSALTVAACEQQQPEELPMEKVPEDELEKDEEDQRESVFDAPWQTYLATSPAAASASSGTTLRMMETLGRSSVLPNPTKTVTTEHMYFYHNPKIPHPSKFIFFAGPASTALGHDIAHCLGLNDSAPNQMDVGSFADGETSIRIRDSVRGKNVFVVQSTISSDALLQLLILIPTLRRASAKHVTVILPYYGYSRQDMRKFQKKTNSSTKKQQHNHREPIAAADVARMLEDVGVDRVICMDLHSDTLLGFFSPRTPVEHILPSPVAAAYFYEQLVLGAKDQPSNAQPQQQQQQQQQQKITIVASHEGQVERATQFRQAFQRMMRHHHSKNSPLDTTTTSVTSDSAADTAIELAVLIKNPQHHNGSTAAAAAAGAQLVGKVEGRQCILVDDIVNTGTTLETNIATLAEAGAASIHAWATHGVFTKEAVQSLRNNAQLEFLLVSNSVPLLADDENDDAVTPVSDQKKIRVLNLAPLLAEVIARVYNNQSLRGLLKRGVGGAPSEASTAGMQQQAPEKTIERYDG